MASLDPSGSKRGATEELPQLPLDLQLQIVQRADAVTVVRCAATHKLLRGGILGPAFRRRLQLGVDPALLLGFSCLEHEHEHEHGAPLPRAIDTPPLSTGVPLVRLNDAITVTGRYKYTPVAWRDGLFVVNRRYQHQPPIGSTPYKLRICNAFTGHVTDFLPPIETTPSGCSAFVLLAGAAGRSFELLVAGRRLHTQIFSSDHWEYGRVRDTTFPQHPHSQGYYDAIPQSQPTVIGRTVYWFCPPRRRSFPFKILLDRKAHILSLDVDAAEATKRNVPTACDLPEDESFNRCVLLTCVRGQLCLFLVESDGISAWTISAASVTTAWSRQFLVTKWKLQARAVLDPREFTDISLHAYGERSCALIARVGSSVFLRLDIGEDFDLARVVRLDNTASLEFLHEIDLVSLLQAMKSFPEGHVSNGPVCEEDLRGEDDQNKHWKVELCRHQKWSAQTICFMWTKGE